MMIDTHCHIDLHDDPVGIISTFERSGVECVSTTMLPSHYQMSIPHLWSRKAIHPSLGLHPLRAKEGKREVSDFISLAQNARYIGEIGLDYSREGAPTKDLQLNILNTVLPSIKGGKFVSVHSRSAVTPLLAALANSKIGPVCFHYFTGGIELATEVIKEGHFISFNLRMLIGKHKNLIDAIPPDRVLIESDAPFLTKSPVTTIQKAYGMVAQQWNLPMEEVTKMILRNFQNCRTKA